MIFNYLKVKLNIEDENKYFDEYLTSKKLNLKSKKYSFNYQNNSILLYYYQKIII